MTQNKDLIIPKQFRIIEKNSGVCVLQMGKIVRVKFTIKGIFRIWRDNIFHTATLTALVHVLLGAKLAL